MVRRRINKLTVFVSVRVAPIVGGWVYSGLIGAWLVGLGGFVLNGWGLTNDDGLQGEDA